MYQRKQNANNTRTFARCHVCHLRTHTLTLALEHSIVWSAVSPASAKSTKKSVPFTRKSLVTNEERPVNHSGASPASMADNGTLSVDIEASPVISIIGDLAAIITKELASIDSELDVESVLSTLNTFIANTDWAAGLATTISLLAKGGYNDVWLVSFRKDSAQLLKQSFVLRVPNSDSLQPHQIRNEVGWLQYMAKHCTEIPVPRVYAYCDGAINDAHPFIALEYIEAISLSEAWKSYNEEEKVDVARKVAGIVVRLGEMRFDGIGGMQADGTMGPTVEGVKLFNGRKGFHNADCYDIGSYASIEQYVLAYYDKEIYYYVNASDSDFDDDYFDDESRADLVQRLKRTRSSAKADLEQHQREEPFVLCHNDLHGRNILMRGTDVASVIDWEFANALPLSELVHGGVEVLEMVDDESVEECWNWQDKVCGYVVQIAKARKWDAKDMQLLTSTGDDVLQCARMEMFPRFTPGGDEDDAPQSSVPDESRDP